MKNKVFLLNLSLIAAFNLELNGAARIKISESFSSEQEKLFDAIEKGNSEKLKSMILRKANINATNAEGDNPLLFALKKFDEHVDTTSDFNVIINIKTILDLLLDNDVDVNISNKQGITPLSFLLHSNNFFRIGLFYQICMKPEIQIQGAFSQEIKVRYLAYRDIFKKIISKTSNIDITGANGATALMAAVGFKDEELIEQLLEKGADLNIKSKYGRTALYIAENIKDIEVEYRVIKELLIIQEVIEQITGVKDLNFIKLIVEYENPNEDTNNRTIISDNVIKNRIIKMLKENAKFRPNAIKMRHNSLKPILEKSIKEVTGVKDLPPGISDIIANYEMSTYKEFLEYMNS